MATGLPFSLNLPKLAPGSYVIQDHSDKRAFLTVNWGEGGDAAPAIALPTGILASVWNIAPSQGERGAYIITVDGRRVIQGRFQNVVAYTGNPQDVKNDPGWNIEAVRHLDTGEICWSIGAPPGPDVLRWTVGMHYPPPFLTRGVPTSGNRNVMLYNNPIVEASHGNLFHLTPIFTNPPPPEEKSLEGAPETPETGAGAPGA